MAEHPHIALVRRNIQAMSAGDDATLQQLYTRDCVVHLPGNHPLAGEHKALDTARRLRRRPTARCASSRSTCSSTAAAT
jgi:ketosteroid isomerase-like protein